MVKNSYKVILFALASILILSGVAYAASWEYKFPINVTDNTSTNRTYYPVLLGVAGDTYIDGGYIDADALNTDLQIGSTSIKYMISTDQVTSVIPNFPANATVVNNFYTGYSPDQSGFSIIVGDGGYYTIPDFAIGTDNFTWEWDGWFDAGATGNISYKEDAYHVYADSSDISAALYDYVSPTGFVDGSGQWSNEANAYDENTGTYAEDVNVPATSWSQYLELTHAAVNCDAVRYYCSGSTADITQIDVDVYYGGAWHDVYEGAFTQSVWERKTIPGGEQSLTSIRIRLYNNNGALTPDAYINEVLYVQSDVAVVPYPNLLTNGSFEDGDPPDDWVLYGAGASYERSNEQAKYGDYSLKLTRGGADCAGYQAIADFADYQGDTVTLGSWVYATVANRARLYVFDGVDSTASNYHSGVAGWEWLTVTHTVNGAAWLLYPQGQVHNGDTSAYFDGIRMLRGSFVASGITSGEHTVTVQMASPFLSIATDTATPITPVETNLVLNAPLWQSECDADPFTTIDENEFSVDVSNAVWSSVGYNFDGDSGYLKISDIASLQNIFDGGATLIYWIRPYSDGENDNGHLWRKRTTRFFVSAEDPGDGDYRVQFIMDFDGTDGNWFTYHRWAYINEWSMVAVTYDSGSVDNDPIIYVDAVPRDLTEAFTPVGTRQTDAGFDLYLGNSQDDNVTFDGDIGEIQVYSKILSADDVLRNYNATKTKYGVSGDIYTYSTLASVPDNANDIVENTNNIFPYLTEVSKYVGGALVTQYAPSQILDGATLADEIGSNDATITWGSNTGVSISYGAMVGYEDTEAGATTSGGFDMPTSLMPATWFAMGENVENLPFYSMVYNVAEQLDFPDTTEGVQSLYFIVIVGIAFAVFIGVVLFARSALLGFISMEIVFFVGSSMTIVPMWIPFAIGIAGLGIIYLYRQVAY